MILIYNDIINLKLNNKNTTFNNYNINKKKKKKLSFENILKKIDILLDLKKYIMNNVNLNLLIDKLIINFEKVNKCQ